MNFVRVHRVVVEYTSSKTRRSVVFVILFVLCFTTFIIWTVDKNVGQTMHQSLSLFTRMPVTNQPRSDVIAPSPSTTTGAPPSEVTTAATTKLSDVTTSFTISQTSTTYPSLLPNTTLPPPIKVYIRPFSYLINEEDFCTVRYPDLFMLTYLHTAPANFEQRTTIRDTWGNRNLYFRLRTAPIFILGKTADAVLTSKIKEESQQHHDIIQEDFVDAYKNLTYKGVAALRWISSHCQTPKFVLKVDDDMLVNTFEIVRFLRKAYKQKPNGKQFLCMFYNRNMPVMRDVKSKWYVSERDYPDKMYLPYCSGSAYIFPTGIIPQLYNVSFTTPFFWVDDVYVTGMLAKSALVKHQSIQELYILYKGANELSQNIVFGNKVFGHFSRKPTKEWRYEFWKNITEVEQWMG